MIHLPALRKSVARWQAGGNVVALEQARILRALGERKRYKYVQPRVLREGRGWKVVSPNCSRNVDSAGGEIDIAWLTPTPEGTWQLFARDHALQCWTLRAAGLSLPDALVLLCEDAEREFWR